MDQEKVHQAADSETVPVPPIRKQTNAHILNIQKMVE
jgi:hypothetical protein